MKIKCYCLALFIVFSLHTMSQKKQKNHLEIAIDGGIPTGAYAKNFSFDIGGNLRYLFYGSGEGMFDVSDAMPMTLSAGYYNAFTKDTSSAKLPSKGVTIIPLMFGIKAPMKKGTYLACELGWAYLDQEKRNSNFSFDLEIGLNLNKFDAGIKFLGLAGKQNYFLGFGSFQLTYKFN